MSSSFREINGQIHCNQISDSRAFRRFTQKQVAAWVERRLARRMSQTQPIQYVVDLRRPGAGHVVDCHVKILAGTEVWVGSNYEGELHQAVIHCLSHMVPGVQDPLPTRH